MRGPVIGALRGDSRSMGMPFRLAEQVRQFEEPYEPITHIQRTISVA
jgi:hypothetical protein